MTSPTSLTFRPVVGKNYDTPGAPFNKRTLVLGGSHYHADFDKLPKSLDSMRAQFGDMTEYVVSEYLDPESSDRWMSTYSKFINSVYNYSTNLADRAQFFDSVVFCNYAQEFAGNNSTKAHTINYGEPRNYEAFLEVLKKYQPDFVICWGAKVWNVLPNDWGYGEADQTPLSTDKGTFKKHYVYPWENRSITLLGVVHPAGGYSRERHQDIFQHAGVVTPSR